MAGPKADARPQAPKRSALSPHHRGSPGSRSDDLRPHPCGGNDGWRLLASLSSIATQKAASLPAKAGVGGETRPRGPAPVAGGTAGRNEVEHPERSEGLPQAASGLAGSRSEEPPAELQALMG